MRKGHKRWGALGAALLLLGAGVGYLRSRTHAHRPGVAPEEPEEIADRWRGFTAPVPGFNAPSHPGPDAGPAPGDNGWLAAQITPQQLETAMQAWREAILQKNVDDLLALDRIFLTLPLRYGPELEKLAVNDPEERIRAFSTRVLGKMKNDALADLFERLLADKSPFVRQNGAWALGELADHPPRGREAALAANAELRHLEGGDPVPEVRSAAANALKKLK